MANFENREIFFSDRQSQSGSDFKTNADFFRSYFLSGDKKVIFEGQTPFSNWRTDLFTLFYLGGGIDKNKKMKFKKMVSNFILF